MSALVEITAITQYYAHVSDSVAMNACQLCRISFADIPQSNYIGLLDSPIGE